MPRPSPRLLLAVTVGALALACTTKLGGEAVPEPTPDPLATLQSDPSGEALRAALQEHTPSPSELQRAAVLWSAMIELHHGRAVDPRLSFPSLAELLKDLPSAYPSLFGRGEGTGALRQALVASPADFVCGGSCEVSRETYGQAMRSTVRAIVSGAAGPATAEVVQALTAALETKVNVDEASTVLSEEAVDGVLRAVVGAARAAGVLGAMVDLPDAQPLVFLVGAWQLGQEVRPALSLAVDCHLWQDQNCCSAPDVPCGNFCCRGGAQCGGGQCVCATMKAQCGTTCCARGEHCRTAPYFHCEAGRYRDNGDGTFTDTRTSKRWELQSHAGPLVEAIAYCEGLSLAGGGWRLPSLEELEGLASQEMWRIIDDCNLSHWSSQSCSLYSDCQLTAVICPFASVDDRNIYANRYRCTR